MKKILVVSMLTLTCLIGFGQGAVTSDGTNKAYWSVQRGAMWHLYPEAQYIAENTYSQHGFQKSDRLDVPGFDPSKMHSLFRKKWEEGSFVGGYFLVNTKTHRYLFVKRISSDHFARFAKGEYAVGNENLIRLKKGMLAYRDLNDGSLHNVNCGNTCLELILESQLGKQNTIVKTIKTVDTVYVKEPTVEVLIANKTKVASTKKKKVHTPKKQSTSNTRQEAVEDCGCNEIAHVVSACTHTHKHCYVAGACSVQKKCGQACVTCYPLVTTVDDCHQGQGTVVLPVRVDCDSSTKDKSSKWENLFFYIVVAAAILLIIFLIVSFFLKKIKEAKESGDSMKQTHIHADIHVNARGTDYTQS